MSRSADIQGSKELPDVDRRAIRDNTENIATFGVPYHHP